MISERKHRGGSGRKQCANGGLASHRVFGVEVRSIWDHRIMGHLKGDSQDVVGWLSFQTGK
jgi:hypothetical protein